jgi:vitamin B12 transporter
LLGGYVAEYDAQQVQFNLRQDRYSDFGAANTSLLGYGVSFADKWRVTASVSNAFKAPTLNDLYFPFTDYGGGFTYSGNPNLKPERSVTQEAGLHYVANGQHVDAVYFSNRIRDLIASNGAGTTSINIDHAQITGQELSYSGEFGKSRLKANATFQNPRNTATGITLLRRAKEFASVTATHDFDQWNAGVELRHSGARQDYAGVILSGYQLLNLNAGYKIGIHLNLLARVDNLFNRNYSESYGYNTLGRTLFVGLNYQQ